MSVQEGQILGKYRIVSKLGAGGMADVYLAEDTMLKRQVAVKILPPEFARDPDRATRFEKEVLHSASLQHPGIVTIHDVGHDAGYHYYTMSLLTGGDLKQRIQGGLQPEAALHILRPVAEALGYAHQCGFVHRDIKPENIMFDDHGKPVLTDFGIAKAVGSGTRMTGTGMSIGTPHYMSPEQARGKLVDGRSDLYSLGVVLYEMLVGQVPFDADDTFAVGLMHINDPPPQLPPSLAKLQPLLNSLLAKDPAQRYQNSGELISAIDQVLNGQPLPKSSQPKATPKTQVMPSAPASSGQNNSGLKWAIGGAVLAAVLIGGVMMLNGDMTGAKTRTDYSGSSTVNSAPVVAVLQTSSQPPKAKPVKTLNPEQQKKQQIADLLKAASEDVKAMRLTKPAGGNAFDRYSEVFTLTSGNEDARDGHLKILATYAKLIDTAKNANQTEKLSNLCEGVRQVFLGLFENGSFADPDELKKYAGSKEALMKGTESIKLCTDDDPKLFNLLLTYNEFSAAEQEIGQYGSFLNAVISQPILRKMWRVENVTATFVADETQKLRKRLANKKEEYAVSRRSNETSQPGRVVVAAKPVAKSYTDPTTGMEFVLVKGGCFQMGSNSDEADEKPVHEVCVDDFYIGKYEVTQAQYQKLIGSNPSSFKGSDRPVEKVSWDDAQAFTRKLSGGKGYRLPTEAEWEYAARSGGRDEKWAGTGSENALGDYAWYNENSGSQTHPVGQKRPNGLGLHDMSGNVWEWCSDWYGDKYYAGSPRNNPQGPRSGSSRVLRGGSWGRASDFTRTAYRDRGGPGNRGSLLGFRVAFPASS